MRAAVFVLAALAPSVLATVSMTAPISSTVWQASQPQTIAWRDDGSAPLLQQFGNSMVSIYVGNAIQQTQLQLITPGVDVSTTGSIIFTPDPTIGPNGDFYFVRFESLVCKDPSTPQNYPCEAFSAKFTLQGMSGTFNASVQAQIDGASTAPIGGPTASSTPPAGSSAPATPPASASSTPASKGASSSSHAASASPTGASKGNGAGGLFANAGVVATVAALLGAMML